MTPHLRLASAIGLALTLILLTGCNSQEKQERKAMEFLYKYMSVADQGDYSVDFFRQNAQVALKARKEMPWGREVPDDLFRHFVLPVRVNNERLDGFRMMYYDTLKARTAGMSMHDAALEINHWCHEKVTYTPSDARTSSPLASILNAEGRCGEESTFTVAAMRTAGIPARQVYTPRWAHTDDNHAWVEVWTDGKWSFLGACEPEPELNMAWFNEPASRAMLMHTLVFGDYNGPEDVIRHTPNFTEINVIGNYVKTRLNTVRVRDAAGNPVKGAKVEFCIYNYGEMYPAVTLTSDSNGAASLHSGIGDLFVWASHEGRYGYGILRSEGSEGSEEKAIADIVLKQTSGTPISLDIDINPPANGKIPSYASDEAIALNKSRLEQENAIRTAYTSTFTTESNAVERLALTGLTANQEKEACRQLIDAKGNWKDIRQFLAKASGNGKTDEALALLKALSRKDLRDTRCDVLEDALNTAASISDLCPDADTYYDYVLCPRIYGEFIQPYHRMIRESLNPNLSSDIASGKETRAEKIAKEIISWTGRYIQLADSLNSRLLQCTPAGVLRIRVSDARSRYIFVVAAMRTYGLPARIDQMTGKAQYLSSREWIDISLDSTNSEASSSGKISPKGTLTMHYNPGEGTLDNPEYYRHFTLSRITDGTRHLLDFEGGDATELGADASAESFSKPFTLDAGTYLLTSGTRLASGSVLARLTSFEVLPGKNTDVELMMRQTTSEICVIGSMDPEATYEVLNQDGSTQKNSILSTTGRGYFLLAVLGESDEPSNHALRELQSLSKSLEGWNRPVIIFGEAKKGAQAVESKVTGSELCDNSNLHYGIDSGNAVRNMLCEGCHCESKTLPVIAVCDSFGRIVYISTGYNTSLASQLSNVLRGI